MHSAETPSITFFVIFSGESTFRECVSSIIIQNKNNHPIDIIAYYAPMDRAFQQMLDRCRTEYFVQVDADMILFPGAINIFEDTINSKSDIISAFDGSTVSDEQVAFHFFPLHDCHLNREIIGIKLYNTEILKKFPYHNSYSTEVEQLDRIRGNGYHIAHVDKVIGYHGTAYDDRASFERYFRLFSKAAKLGSAAHSYDWLKPLPNQFLSDYVGAGRRTSFWALIGAVSGTVLGQSPQSETERDYRLVPSVFTNLKCELSWPDAGFVDAREQYPRIAAGHFSIFDLAHLADGVSHTPASIVLVTDEYPEHLSASGGIGTFCQHLQRVLADQKGIDLTILLVNLNSSAAQSTVFATSKTLEVFPHFVQLDVSTTEKLSSTSDKMLLKSLVVKDYLAQKNFDYAVFADFGALAYYSIQAKRAASGFDSTKIIVHGHGSSGFVRSETSSLMSAGEMARVDGLENFCIEWADVFLCPSKAYLSWLEQNNVRPPEQTFFAPNVFEPEACDPNHAQESHVDTEFTGRIKSIIYYGKHDDNKGLEFFIDGLILAAEKGLNTSTRIVIAGRFGFINHQWSGAFLIQKLSRFPFNVEIDYQVTSKIFRERYSPHDTLVVFCSRVENQPYALIELGAMGYRMIAADVGGIAELFSSPAPLFKRELGNFSDKILAVYDDISFAPPALAINYKSLSWAWRHWWHGLRILDENQGKICRPFTNAIEVLSPLRVQQRREREIDIAVIITHKDRPEMLIQCLRSVLNQTIKPVKIVVVDDNSNDENHERVRAFLEKIPAEVHVIRTSGIFLGAARNHGLNIIENEFVLFVDDDDVLAPDCLEKLHRALDGAPAEVATALNVRFDGASYLDRFEKSIFSSPGLGIDHLPAPADVVSPYFENYIGGATMMVRTDFVRRGNVRFSEEKNRVFEDHQFYNSILSHGGRVIVVPEVLYGYRNTSGSMIKTFDATESVALVRKNYRREFHGTNELASVLRYIDIENTSRSKYQEIWKAIDKSAFRDVCWELSRSSEEDRVRIFFEHISQRGAILTGSTDVDRSQPSRKLAEDSSGHDLFRSDIDEVDISNARSVVSSLRAMGITNLEDISDIYPHDKLGKYVILIEIVHEITEREVLDENRIEYYRKILTTASREYGITIDIAAATSEFYRRSGSLHSADEFERIARTIQNRAYYEKYPDVGTAAAKGRVTSAAAHYEEFGMREGRELPQPILSWPVFSRQRERR